ncbi:hypothetical protein HPB50_017954 [Hyalomma asiaticum]|uniref:Uncharacterized protein n=1 Tax=Hyalomma asiaticum TaxID=266040 RepID=A0ACB7T833_HYAAI|nr:hypothetical protein HPB50_017954 [Hyalomma asiaticum]
MMNSSGPPSHLNLIKTALRAKFEDVRLTFDASTITPWGTGPAGRRHWTTKSPSPQSTPAGWKVPHNAHTPHEAARPRTRSRRQRQTPTTTSHRCYAWYQPAKSFEVLRTKGAMSGAKRSYLPLDVFTPRSPAVVCNARPRFTLFYTGSRVASYSLILYCSGYQSFCTAKAARRRRRGTITPHISPNYQERRLYVPRKNGANFQGPAHQPRSRSAMAPLMVSAGRWLALPAVPSSRQDRLEEPAGLRGAQDSEAREVATWPVPSLLTTNGEEPRTNTPSGSLVSSPLRTAAIAAARIFSRGTLESKPAHPDQRFPAKSTRRFRPNMAAPAPRPTAFFLAPELP